MTAIKSNITTASTEQPISPLVIKGQPLNLFSLSISRDIFNAWRSIFQYQGFDPMSLLKSLLVTAESNGLSMESFLNDMLILLVWYVERGTAFTRDRTVKRTDPIAYKLLRKTLARYGVVSNLDRNIVTSDIPTLGRIASCFPHLVAQMMSYGGRDIGASALLPKSLKFPGAASLIMNTQQSLLNAFIDWSYEFDKVVNKDIKQDESRKERIKAFAMTAYNSSYLSQDARLYIQVHYELISNEEYVRVGLTKPIWPEGKTISDELFAMGATVEITDIQGSDINTLTARMESNKRKMVNERVEEVKNMSTEKTVYEELNPRTKGSGKRAKNPTKSGPPPGAKKGSEKALADAQRKYVADLKAFRQNADFTKPENVQKALAYAMASIAIMGNESPYETKELEAKNKDGSESLVRYVIEGYEPTEEWMVNAKL